MQSDQLVRHAVSGDAVALQTLLLRHYEFLLRIVRRRLPLDLERFIDPEDIVQNAHIEAFESIRSLTQLTDAAFKAWMRTIGERCVSQATAHHRALKRGGKGLGKRGEPTSPANGIVNLPHADGHDPDGHDSVHGILELLAKNSRSPASLAGDREYIELITDALHELSPDDRAALELHYLKHRPHAEVAATLGKTEAAVKMMCLRGLRRLRGLLP